MLCDYCTSDHTWQRTGETNQGQSSNWVPNALEEPQNLYLKGQDNGKGKGNDPGDEGKGKGPADKGKGKGQGKGKGKALGEKGKGKKGKGKNKALIWAPARHSEP